MIRINTIWQNAGVVCVYLGKLTYIYLPDIHSNNSFHMMRFIYISPYCFLCNMAFVFSCVLMVQCNRNNQIDYAHALKICSEKNPAEGPIIFLPSTDCVVGTRFPRFECITINNKKINEDYFRGKIGIVNFWFEGCAPCVAEVPGFNQLAHTYGKDKLRYVAISTDSQEDVEAFLKNHDWDFDHVSDGKSIVTNVFHLPWGYPTTFLIDQQGIIRKILNGGKTDSTAVAMIKANLMPDIDRLLSEM